MRIETRELGVALSREGRAYVEYAVFGALREFAPQVDLVNVCLRRKPRGRAVTCVMAAHLLPAGRAVVVLRASHPYAVVDRAAAELRSRVEHERPPLRPGGERTGTRERPAASGSHPAAARAPSR